MGTESPEAGARRRAGYIVGGGKCELRRALLRRMDGARSRLGAESESGRA